MTTTDTSNVFKISIATTTMRYSKYTQQTNEFNPNHTKHQRLLSIWTGITQKCIFVYFNCSNCINANWFGQNV